MRNYKNRDARHAIMSALATANDARIHTDIPTMLVSDIFFEMIKGFKEKNSYLMAKNWVSYGLVLDYLTDYRTAEKMPSMPEIDVAGRWYMLPPSRRYVNVI